MTARTELLQGSLDLLVLKTLDLEPLHGWAIAKRIQLLSRDVLEVNQGSLYPALYRLRDRGLIESEFGESEEGRRVKVYALTPKGRAALVSGEQSWRLFADAVEAILAAG
ncbi:MAG: PadR family transcriptional regulator [Gemmatimonadetes bacterium]|nr:PadR family transcriptional regulator [Gemmatimonadota bacterium]